MEIEIIPTILTKEAEEVGRKVRELEGKVERFQFDFIDGLFLPEKTTGIEVLEEIETSLKIDVHLMTRRPEEWVEKVACVLADRVIGQVEKMNSQKEFIEAVVGSGLQVGLALAPESQVESIEENLDKADLVLVMTRQPGFGKFPFEERMLEKVKKIRSLTSERFDICVDGGVNEENIKKCVQAGANLIAIGDSLWQTEDLEARIEKLKNLVS